MTSGPFVIDLNELKEFKPQLFPGHARSETQFLLESGVERFHWLIVMTVGPVRHTAADSEAAKLALVKPAPELASQIGMGQ